MTRFPVRKIGFPAGSKHFRSGIADFPREVSVYRPDYQGFTLRKAFFAVSKELYLASTRAKAIPESKDDERLIGMKLLGIFLQP